MSACNARLYYAAPNLLQHVATVVAIDANQVRLDATVFHPQGGGQPSDTGTINGIPVSKVYVDGDDVIHLLETAPNFAVGDQVALIVEESPRKLFSRLHSAGHLLAHVAEQEFPGLKAVQGHHFPNEARVEFTFTEAPDLDTFKQKLSDALQNIIANNINVRTSFDNGVRRITFGDYEPTPCGGTHVQELTEIGAILIRNVKNKGGRIRVGYDVT